MKPDIQLALPARAENIAIVRHALGALGESFAVDPQTISDIRLAVTEACTNVVVHAYPDGQEGSMEVLASLLEQELTLVVRDHGKGITPRADSPGLGLGLPLIASLTESVQLGRDEQERTEVRMTFSLANGHHRGSESTPQSTDQSSGIESRTSITTKSVPAANANSTSLLDSQCSTPPQIEP